jgi:hypothetical protein
MLLYPMRTISIGTLQDYIAEWQSPDFHAVEVQPFLIAFFLTVFAMSISKIHRTATDYLLVFVFGFMGFMAVRNIALFALVSAPILTRHLDSGLEPLLRRRKPQKEIPPGIAKTVNLILAIFFLMVASFRIVTQLPEEVNLKRIGDQIPLEAFRYLVQNKPPGPLFNSYNWGGYVLWKLFPDYLSFVDGRTDLFKDEILDPYLHTWLAEPGWESLLDDWGIRLALIERHSPLAAALIFEGWNIYYQDDAAIILGRDLSTP